MTAQQKQTQELTYEDALHALFHNANYQRRGRKYNNPTRSLERVRLALNALGNPQHSFQAVHVTGTKGKGSTSAYAESILRGLGYRTGLFTSPHLHTFRERIRLNGSLIQPEEMARLMAQALPHFNAIPDLTVFDRITALAFLAFQQAGVEWAVVEVGLGGRLDSTNVLRPAVCGITRISKDHTHILGDTLAQIAGEKAGIIKPGVPVFIAPQKPEAEEVLRRVAQERAAPLAQVVPFQATALPMFGHHQQINAGVAFEMAQNLHSRGLIAWDQQQVEAGLAHTHWPARIEWLPLPHTGVIPLVVDCAHNLDSLEILLSTLANRFPQRPSTFIFGVNKDKDIGPMLACLTAACERIVLVQSRHPKALPVPQLRDALAAASTRPNLTVISAASMQDGLEAALALSPPEGFLIGTGSVFVAAELREAWNARYPGLFPENDWVHQADTDPPLAPMPTAYGTV